jgi:hypothetical protein
MYDCRGVLEATEAEHGSQNEAAMMAAQQAR